MRKGRDGVALLIGVGASGLLNNRKIGGQPRLARTVLLCPNSERHPLIIKTERAATRKINRFIEVSLVHNSPSPMLRNTFMRSAQRTALATCLHSLSQCQ